MHELSTGDGNNDNMLIQANNLDALKTLLPFYAGRIKCVYIDPPYNTRSAFEHYDDNLEHTRWLAMMWPRLELLRELLSEDGSIWVSIDDNEQHHLRMLMDDIFGIGNFIATVIWNKMDSPKNTALHVSEDHESLHSRPPCGCPVELTARVDRADRSGGFWAPRRSRLRRGRSGVKLRASGMAWPDGPASRWRGLPAVGPAAPCRLRAGRTASLPCRASAVGVIRA